MKKSILLLLLASSAWADVKVPAEHSTTVTLSNTDLNRLVCEDGEINNVFYSEEKGLTVAIEGHNAFVKYLIKQTGDEPAYITTSTELHVICDGKTFTLIAQPTQGNAKTVRLVGGNHTALNNTIKRYGGLDHEQRLVTLMRQIYRNELDDNFAVTQYADPLRVFPADVKKGPFFENLSIVKQREVRLLGVGLRATEYQLTARYPMRLTETDFLEADLGHQIAAITVSRFALKAGESARLIIIQ
ncbi:MAG: type-F conjugative transfer system secretin TraK [Gammaproteobacteria bacterium]